MTPSGGRPYTIPSDNPFAGGTIALPEIWAYGLRNPWRFSFDRQTGDLWIGDVGQNLWEEIDFEPAGSKGGRNYGWNRFEGRHRYGTRPLAGPTVLPVAEYSHIVTEGCAVTGGYVYRGEAIPSLQGEYLFGDFCVGRVMVLRRENGRILGPRWLGVTVNSLASFGEDQNGELYALSLAGGVFRIVPG